MISRVVRGGEPQSVGDIMDESPELRRIIYGCKVRRTFRLFLQLMLNTSSADLIEPAYTLLNENGVDTLTLCEYVGAIREVMLDQIREGKTPEIMDITNLFLRLYEDKVLPARFRDYVRFDV